ncbi:DUF7573 domain-containing protein [Haladaptatus sp. ZSTT2]|uniref:DUF7573 domain-containing protein n=1 Tax=Haladaptatus sp. ZSTT2 TaxID=3120515 RepID=UPI00300F0027
MSEDSTLDAFAGGEAAEEEADAAPEPSANEIAPATSTYAWSPEGAACEACGEVVERRWRDGDELVCESCKSW